MNQVLKGGPHVPNNQLYQTLGVPVAIWGRGGPKPVWVGTWPAGRRGAASTGSCAVRLRRGLRALKNAPLGRLSAESDKAAWQAPSHEYGGGDGAVGGGLGGRFVPLTRKGDIFRLQCFPGSSSVALFFFFFVRVGRVGLLGEVQKPQF